MTKITLTTEKQRSKGKMKWSYGALKNMKTEEGCVSFDTDEIALDVNHPVDIECQPSYDGSVNLIMNDDLSAPRIINSGFTVRENNNFERIVRNQAAQTNVYRKNYIDSESRLQRTTSTFLDLRLGTVSTGGTLPGGTYIFFVQYSDDDMNYSKIVAESGPIIIYNGDLSSPSGIIGTLLEERTDKKITLVLKNIDTSYSKIRISYQRSYGDQNGQLIKEYKTISHLYSIEQKGEMTVVVDGIEEAIDTTYTELIKRFNIYSAVKSQAQTQNMLFFANVEEKVDSHADLQRLSYCIGVAPIMNEDLRYTSPTFHDSYGEYYVVKNTYDYIGYMPGEYYRLGIVYVYNDDSTSAVYNLKGCEFNTLSSYEAIKEHQCVAALNDPEKYSSKENILISEIFIKEGSLANSRGVFRMPHVSLYTHGEKVTPLSLCMIVPNEIKNELKKLGVKGYFFVRQPRIPIFLAQACSIGVSTHAYIPMLTFKNDAEDDVRYYSESPITLENEGTLALARTRINVTNNNDTQYGAIRGLLCQDVKLIPKLQSLFCGNKFCIQKVGTYEYPMVLDPDTNTYLYNNRWVASQQTYSNGNIQEVELLYIPQDDSVRMYKNYVFSTKAGSSVDVKSLRHLEKEVANKKLNDKCIRGNYTAFLGVIIPDDERSAFDEDYREDILEFNSVYNIYTSEYPNTLEKSKQCIRSRAEDHTAFVKICDPVSILSEDNISNCYRGDCFTCTSTIKFLSNFLDSQAPLNDKIVKGSITNNDSTSKLFEDFSKIDAPAWLEINTSDVNTVPIGHLFTYKHLSNFNLNIRSIDDQNLDEMALYGSPRDFYPRLGYSKTPAFKIPESLLYNEGYSATTAVLPYFEYTPVPYIKHQFENRIAFSNIFSNESFANNYRVFSDLSYQDIEKTYGAITKILPLGSNLFCVFEHGCGIIPINEKALLSTTTGQSIHLYGAGVLPSQVTIISPDYGSTWEDSVVVTPNGIYGVDTVAKKIWKYSASSFELISDQIVQRFLNDNLILTENDQTTTLAIQNVKTHYNEYKGDIMFTFYSKDKCWNLCYNERINKFVSRYSWTPVLSENIQNSFVSIDKERVAIYTQWGQQFSSSEGLVFNSSNTKYPYIEDNYIAVGRYFRDLREKGNLFNTAFKFESVFGDNITYNDVYIKSISYPIWDDGIETIHTVYPKAPNSFYGNILSDSEGISKCSVVGWDERTYSEESLTEFDDKYCVLTKEDLLKVDTISEDDMMTAEELQVCNLQNKFKNYVTIYSGKFPKVEVKLNSYVSWIKIEVSCTPYNEDMALPSHTQTLCLIADSSTLSNINRDIYDKTLRIGVYTHGRAGIYDEINYADTDDSNEIRPTLWYNKQEPFEFEFVVNTPTGIQKIFDNLVIISNNAEPGSLEISFIGDSYDFNKAGIFKASQVTPKYINGIINENELSKDKKLAEFGNNVAISQDFDISLGNHHFSTVVDKDIVLNQYYLRTTQECKNVSSIGKRLGNIEYIEDKWRVSIGPILFKNKTVDTSGATKSALLRDKWCKIRIKYKGDRLAVITAIQTFMTLSYA